MLRNPGVKYRPAPTVNLPDRTWPNRTITTAPVWMSTDLRDGNQSLIEPMNAEKKLRFFQQLVQVGIKEIEVAFPSASQTDFDFVRSLIENDHIPDDVTIEVLTQARPELIQRTFDSVRGAKRAIIHMYNAIAPSFRRIVFDLTREQVIEIAVAGTRLIKQLTDSAPETEWIYEYSPETFSMAELDFAKEICDAVSKEWGATPNRKIIINCPSTVECSTPNVYADQIEWMHRNLAYRDSTILSLHPHNDRGTAVASAELAIMAGADRVEGCLFGNGERTGNVDLVTLALNLYTQGVDPGLDFSDIDAVRQCVEYCNDIPVHPRHPYVGDLVFTAFSGSHQDAIKKGFAKQQPNTIWDIPYLPIDPADLGRSYDAVIRVNSQSGKGGIAYLLETDYGFNLPRRLQIEFSRAIQLLTDRTGREVRSDDVYDEFCKQYLDHTSGYEYVGHHVTENAQAGHHIGITVELLHNHRLITVRGQGNGPIDAFVNALNMPIRVMDYVEHAMASGANAPAVSYVEMRIAEQASGYGVGIDQNIVTASLKAVISGLNRHLQKQGNPEEQIIPIAA